MSDGKEKTSFWETIPGIITAIGTLLAGSAALITALYSAEIIGPARSGTSPSQASTAEMRTTQQTPLAPSLAEPEQGYTMTEPITGMKFVYVPEGCFMMGSDDGGDDEKPVHKVCVDAFRMGKYEVTQGQWLKIMGTNPAHFQKGDSYSVERVSWDDSQGFIKKLNIKTGKQYRLPTEAEWEYACRANSTGKYCGGDKLNDLAWYSENSGKSTHPVGKKQSNSFGLHDMSGNVWEWCLDRYDANYYSTSPQDNPTGSSSGSKHSIRGGSWFNSPGSVRSVYRYGNSPDDRVDDLGFRLVLPVQ
ncbi:MAG: formylglycine-generating enzyme family protein [Candidatus Electrothrix sp. AR5]|nr:formylglycine-generating enzyme family protein [Candidatus Electrothrix sp. AR5]